MIRAPTSRLKAAGICAILALLMASSGLSATNAATSNSVSAPAGTCVSAITQTYDSMNQTTAVANAKASDLYSQGVASFYQPTFNSIFQIDKGTNSCEEDVESYNVVFVLHNSTGSTVANLVISESQSLSILGSSIQPDNHAVNSNPLPQAHYAGYSVAASTSQTIDVYTTYIEYNQSTAQYPSSNCQNSLPCYVSTWTGLTDEGNGGGNIVQDGTTAECKGSSSCSSTSYFAWYETVGTNGVYENCTASNGGAVTISSGDDIYAYVLNNYYNGGSNSSYTVFVEDLRTDTSCDVGDVSFSTMTAPTWAEWITELPMYPSGEFKASLAEFGTVSFTNLAFENSSTGNNISPYTAYQDGYYESFTFESGVCNPSCSSNCSSITQNISTNTMDSSGDFTNHWDSSTNTPGACPIL